MPGGEGLWTRPHTALAAAVALHPQLPSPATFPLGHRQKDLYSIIYIFHYEIAISFPAFYLIHPELKRFFLSHSRGLAGLCSFSCEAVTVPGSYPQEAPAADLAGPRQDPRSPFPCDKGTSVHSASTGLPGRLWLVYTVGQCRFVNLIQAAFSSHGVEVATEPPLHHG